jgi:hypothetical protein
MAIILRPTLGRTKEVKIGEFENIQLQREDGDLVHQLVAGAILPAKKLC